MNKTTFTFSTGGLKIGSVFLFRCEGKNVYFRAKTETTVVECNRFGQWWYGWTFEIQELLTAKLNGAISIIFGAMSRWRT